MPQFETDLSLLCVLDICADMFNYSTEHVRERRGKGHERHAKLRKGCPRSRPPVRPSPDHDDYDDDIAYESNFF